MKLRKGAAKMRYSEKGETAHRLPGSLFSTDLHSSAKMEQDPGSFETAPEFGLTSREVKTLKKHLKQS